MSIKAVAVLVICTITTVHGETTKTYNICTSDSDLQNVCIKWSDKAKIRHLISESRNSEFYFSQGTYTLDDNVVLTNAVNTSIVGASPYITFDCRGFNASLVTTNSSFVTLRNIRFLNCSNFISSDLTAFSFPSFTRAAIFIYNVSSLVISNVLIGNSCGHGIIGLNIVGRVLLEQVKVYGDNTATDTCNRDKIAVGGIILLNYIVRGNDDELRKDTTIDIKECMFSNYKCNKIIFTNNTQRNNNPINRNHLNSSAIGLILHQVNYHIDVIICNTTIENITSANGAIVTVSYSQKGKSNVSIRNSKIHKTTTIMLSTISLSFEATTEHTVANVANIGIIFNQFLFNSAYSILRMKHIDGTINMKIRNNVFIKNTVRKLFQTENTVPLFSGYTNFINNTATSLLIVSTHLVLDNNATLLFVDNRYDTNYELKHRNVIQTDKKTASSICVFQFKSVPMANITFTNNTGFNRTIYGNSLCGCSWISGNILDKLPTEVFSKVIHFKGNQPVFTTGYDNNIFQCNGNITDCLNVKEISTYPGQGVTMNFLQFKFNIALYTDFNESRFSTIGPTCNVSSHDIQKPKVDLILQQCNKVTYTIESTSARNTMCILMLRTATIEKTIYAFRINLLNCESIGFYLDTQKGICTCHPLLVKKLAGLKCDIITETFITPPGGIWISRVGNDTAYTDNCRSGYCSLLPSLLHLNQPDNQCWPSRSGIACGQCAKGLSTLFGTLRCARCSNYWLLMILVYALAGILLVVTLFVLNLTVVDGDMNGFILMVNILNIHGSRIFPSDGDASYILVSLANLDLGFEVCFYNGMTQYTATWLRFVFPVYVLLIVAGLVFASRYFTLIEKLTRKRVIPVIATLYILTYNKIMLVTFKGLFSYTVIHYLNSGKTQIYWRDDTGVPLFGLRFILLFVFCLFLFLTLIIPTNILLLFTRTAYRSKFVVRYFKPFLDAYQAPFKNKHAYFLGLEFAMRALASACITSKPQDTVAIYSTTLLLYIIYMCWSQPFKSSIKSAFYSLYLLYMGLYVVLFTRYFPLKQDPYGTIFNSIVYLGFAQFLGLVVFHLWKYVLSQHACFISCKDIFKRWIRDKTIMIWFSIHNKVKSNEELVPFAA